MQIGISLVKIRNPADFEYAKLISCGWLENQRSVVLGFFEAFLLL